MSNVPETLDPRDWDGHRAVAHRMVDDAVDYIRDIRTRPVWQDMPPTVRKRFLESVPREGQTLDEIYVEKGYLTKQHRSKIQSVQSQHADSMQEARFGEIGISLGLFDRAQLEKCQAIQKQLKAKKQNRAISEVLLAKHFLTRDAMHQIVAEQTLLRRSQDSKRFGTIALASRILGKSQLKQALDLQEAAIRKDLEQAPDLGTLLVRLGHLQAIEASVLVRAQRRSEITGRSPRELVDQMRAGAHHESGDSQVGSISGLFDGARLKGLDSLECPFCGYEISQGADQCPRCAKVLE